MSPEKRTKRTHINSKFSPIFSVEKPENRRKGLPFLSFFRTIPLPPNAPRNSISPSILSFVSEGWRLTEPAMKLKYKASPFLRSVSIPCISTRWLGWNLGQSVCVPLMDTLTSTVLLIPDLAGRTTLTGKDTKELLSLSVRICAARLMVPLIVTLHLIIQNTNYWLSVDESSSSSIKGARCNS